MNKVARPLENTNTFNSDHRHVMAEGPTEKEPLKLKKPEGPTEEQLKPEELAKRRIFTYRNFQFQCLRERTFENFPETVVTGRECAKWGFIYLHTDDLVQCVYCKGIMGYWDEGDTPESEHRKHFPTCPLFDRGLVTNITSEYEPLEKAFLSMLEKEVPPNMESRLTADAALVDVREQYPEYAPYFKRIRSFYKPPPNMPHVEKMAESGLFFIGLGDMAQCYACGGGIFNWSKEEEPEAVHRRMYPHCKLSKSEKKIDYDGEKPEEEEREQPQEEQFGIDSEIFMNLPLAKKLTEIQWTKEMVRDSFSDQFKRFGTLPNNLGEAIDVVSDYEFMLKRQAQNPE